MPRGDVPFNIARNEFEGVSGVYFIHREHQLVYVGLAVNIGDPIFTLQELFNNGASSQCKDAQDVNDDGLIDIGDGIYGLSALFSNGPAPPAPGRVLCGEDPTVDGIRLRRLRTDSNPGHL